MKLYTQTGDQGKTSLLSGQRVSKRNLRIKAYGEVDELNAVIGTLAAALSGSDQVVGDLQQIQSDLFQLGAWLSATPGSAPRQRLKPLDERDSRRLEALIDRMTEGLPELKAFILPGGCPAAAFAHLARTVCRRSERALIELAEQGDGLDSVQESVAPGMIYLNRLSDYFFVLARFLNYDAGRADIIWKG